MSAEEQVPDLGAAMPFAGLLGIEAKRSHQDGLSATMGWRADLCTVGGQLHGGALMSAADAVGAAAASARLPLGASTTTVSSSTSFLAGVGAGNADVRSFIEHAGRRFITVRTEVRDDTGRLVSITLQTQAVLHTASMNAG